MGSRGVGTALAYPASLGAVANHSNPDWKATAIGVYRLWRDLGYAVGALAAGFAADRLGVPSSIVLTGIITVASGAVIARSYASPTTQFHVPPESRSTERARP